MIHQGAEARIYLGNYGDKQCLIKERFAKRYRHADLDEQICKQRMKAELKGIARCVEASVLVPEIYHVDWQDRKIYMKYFANAITAKEYIERMVSVNKPTEHEKLLRNFCQKLGDMIGNMHAKDIIHGDLTTSNLLVVLNDNDGRLVDYTIVMIDFGLSQRSGSVEDKAVDLYVLERTLSSTHNEYSYLFPEVLNAYVRQCDKQQVFLAKLEEVRARGRKKNMLG